MTIFDDMKAIEDLEVRGARAVDDSKPLLEWGRDAMALARSLRAQIEANPLQIRSAGEQARGCVFVSPERVESPLSASSLPPAQPRKQRSDAGKPRKKTEGAPVLLTPEARLILTTAFGGGPDTLTGLALKVGNITGAGKFFRSTAEAPEQIEAMLFEDAETFVSFLGRREGDSEDRILWGTFDQFYAAFLKEFPMARSRVDGNSPGETKSVMDRMGCSGGPAKRAIGRALKEGGGVA